MPIMLRDDAALMVIGLQQTMDDPARGKRNNPRVEETIGRLLAAWRESGRPVIHVRHVSEDPGSVYGPAHNCSQFKEVAVPVPGELIITKHTPSAFVGTCLEATLWEECLDTLVLCGMTTNTSVEATARMSGCLGYQTYVAADATATFDKRDFAGILRSADEVHALSLANLHGEYATVVRCAELVEGLGVET